MGPLCVDGEPELTAEEVSLCRVLADPGEHCARRYWRMWPGTTDLRNEYEKLHVWQARAVLASRVQEPASQGLPDTREAP